jgi:hypothetical protein
MKTVRGLQNKSLKGVIMKNILLLFAATLVIYSVVFTQVPQKISYQGLLTTSSGTPVQDGSYNLKFEIFNLPVGGTLRHSETQTGVQVQKGTFSVFMNPSPTIFSESLCVEVTILAGPGFSSPLTFSPRSELSSAPYSLAPWTISGNNIYYNSGYVGIGTTSPSDQLEVSGAIRANQFRGPLFVNGGNITFAADGGDHIFTTAVTERMRVTVGGKVGIGTSSPSEQLEITGNLRLPTTTATTGIIMAGPATFLHGYGSYNTFLGENSGNLTMSGSGNVATGTVALHNNSTGNYNTAYGYHALENNTTGYENTAIGMGALMSNRSGIRNTVIGSEGMYGHKSGDGNTAIGDYALGGGSDSGSHNVAIGLNVLLFNESGKENTAGGTLALMMNYTGNYNTTFGYQSLYGNLYGSYNSTFGYKADVASPTLVNATAIGSGAIVNASNKVRIGNTTVTVIEGQVAWSYPSDVRLKKEITDSDLGLEFISKLRPVSFKMKNATDDNLNYGFIAQEVEVVLDGKPTNIVITDNGPEKMKTMRYTELIAPLVKAFQEQQKVIERMQQEIEELKNRK